MFAAVEFPEASLFLSDALIPETGYFPTILHSLTVLACKARVQLWNRQASIIMGLTTLTLRHGWRCPPRI